MDLSFFLFLILFVGGSEGGPNPKTNFKFPLLFPSSNSLTPSNPVVSKYSASAASLPKNQAQSDSNSFRPLEEDTPTGALECFKCNDFKNCEETWNKIRDNANDPSILETCSTYGDHCVVHYSTKLEQDPFKHQMLVHQGSMYIDRSGCEAPKDFLDDGGCTSTPVINKIAIVGKIIIHNKKKIDRLKFVGTHGTRSCYCSSDRCNTNALSCHQCQTNVQNEKCASTTLENAFDYGPRTLARECFIRLDGKGLDVGGSRAFIDLGDHYKESPKRSWRRREAQCDEEFTVKSKSIPTHSKSECGCSSNGCNEMIDEIRDHIAKSVTGCYHCNDADAEPHKCLSDGESEPCENLGEVCFTKYVQKTPGGDFNLDVLGCQPPPQLDSSGETLLWNGCTKPTPSDNGMSRTCVCNNDGSNCNSRTYKCFTCSTANRRSCEKFRGVKETVCETLIVGESKKKECFLSYDDSDPDSKPSLLAGCRDSTFNNGNASERDPDCDEDLISTWIGAGDKKSCQCDTLLCNGVKLLLPGLVDPNPTPKPEGEELTCYSCTDEECLEEEVTSCGADVGCLYTQQMVEMDAKDEVVYVTTRGCALDKDGTVIKMEEGQRCRKVAEGNLIRAQCVCFQDECNVDMEKEFDSILDEIPDPGSAYRRTPLYPPEPDQSGGGRRKRPKPRKSRASGDTWRFCPLFGVLVTIGIIL